MSEYYNWNVGIKVICANGRFNGGTTEWGEQVPTAGKVYTICEVVPCLNAYTGKHEIGLQFAELRNPGDRLAFPVWQFKPVEKSPGAVVVTEARCAEDPLSRRIAELEGQISLQRYEIEGLQESKKKLCYILEWLDARCKVFQTKEQAESHAAEEAEARCAHELHLLEKAKRELDAENELIAKERDALQTKLIELETICDQQRVEIQRLSDAGKDGEREQELTHSAENYQTVSHRPTKHRRNEADIVPFSRGEVNRASRKIGGDHQGELIF